MSSLRMVSGGNRNIFGFLFNFFLFSEVAGFLSFGIRTTIGARAAKRKLYVIQTICVIQLRMYIKALYISADYRSMHEAPSIQTLEALERRIAELEADISVIGRVIRHLERVVLNQPREDQ
jgi:hypothetical protein